MPPYKVKPEDIDSYLDETPASFKVSPEEIESFLDEEPTPPPTQWARDDKGARLSPDSGTPQDVLGIASQSDKAAYIGKDQIANIVTPVPAMAMAQTRKGAGGLLRQAGEVFGSPSLTKKGTGLREEADLVSQQIEQEHPLRGTVAPDVRSGLSSFYQNAPFMAAGGLVGAASKAAGLATGLAPMGALTEGDAYAKYREKGFGVGTATLGGLTEGGIEVGTELLPFAKMIDIATPAAQKGFREVAKNLIEYAGADYAGEALATLGQDLTEKVMANPNSTNEERQRFVEQYFSPNQDGKVEAWENFKSTMVSTTPMVMLGGGAAVLASKRSSVASQGGDALDQAAAGAGSLGYSQRRAPVATDPRFLTPDQFTPELTTPEVLPPVRQQGLLSAANPRLQLPAPDSTTPIPLGGTIPMRSPNSVDIRSRTDETQTGQEPPDRRALEKRKTNMEKMGVLRDSASPARKEEYQNVVAQLAQIDREEQRTPIDIATELDNRATSKEKIDISRFSILNGEWRKFLDSINEEKPLKLKTKFGSSLLSRNTTSDNAWRVTRFDDDGQPIGHSEFQTYREAVGEFSRDGKRVDFIKALNPAIDQGETSDLPNVSSNRSEAQAPVPSLRETSAKEQVTPVIGQQFTHQGIDYRIDSIGDTIEAEDVESGAIESFTPQEFAQIQSPVTSGIGPTEVTQNQRSKSAKEDKMPPTPLPLNTSETSLKASAPKGATLPPSKLDDYENKGGIKGWDAMNEVKKASESSDLPKQERRPGDKSAGVLSEDGALATNAFEVAKVALSTSKGDKNKAIETVKKSVSEGKFRDDIIDIISSDNTSPSPQAANAGEGVRQATPKSRRAVVDGLKSGEIKYTDLTRGKDGKFTTWSYQGETHAYTEGAVNKEQLIATLEGNLPKTEPKPSGPKNTPAHTETVEVTGHKRDRLIAMREEINAGQAGKRIPVTADMKEWTGIPSTFPEYFKDKGLSKADVLNIIDRALEPGAKLTPKQAATLKDLTTGRNALVMDGLMSKRKERQAQRRAEFDFFKVDETAKADNLKVARELYANLTDDEAVAILNADIFGDMNEAVATLEDEYADTERVDGAIEVDAGRGQEGSLETSGKSPENEGFTYEKTVAGEQANFAPEKQAPSFTRKSGTKGEGVTSLDFNLEAGLFDEPGNGVKEVKRHEIGASLTKEERKAVMGTLTDVYKDNNLEMEERLDSRGESYFAWPHRPEYFVKSDITGQMVRYYVTLPSKQVAHPSELFPEMTQSTIDKQMVELAAKEEQEFLSDKEMNERADRLANADRIKVRADYIESQTNKDHAARNLVEFYSEKEGKWFATQLPDRAEKALSARGYKRVTKYKQVDGKWFPADRETGYFNGDKVEFTDEPAPEGFRSFVYIEGTKNGQSGVKRTDEAKAADIAKDQKVWQDQQEGFSRLNADATEKSVTKKKPVPKDQGPVLRLIGTVRVDNDVRLSSDQRYKVDRHIVEYRDNENNEYRKSFFVRRGEEPNIPKSGTSFELSALSDQHKEEIKSPPSPKEEKKGKVEAVAPKVEISTVSARDDFHKKLYAGEVTIDDFRAAFTSLLANKDAILADIDKMTKTQIFEKFPGLQWRWKNEKKSDVVNALYQAFIGEFSLGEGVSYGMGKNSYENAVQKKVNSYSQQDLDQYAADYKKNVEERIQQRAALKEAVKDPKTREDFDNYIRLKKNEGMTFTDARLTLTPEQRATYDILVGESTRNARKETKEERQGAVSVAGQTVSGQIIETKHTMKGHDLFVVQLAERVSKEDYTTLNAAAKKMGGYYSSFRGRGAVPGFQFTTRETAEAFVALAGGDKTAAQEAVQERRNAFADDKSQTAVERLNEMADALEEKATASLNRDRKANTDRRARMASSAEAEARRGQAFAVTMRNIADAIERGDAKFLDRVRQKVQVEFLHDALRSAHYEELREKYPEYGDRLKHEGEKPTSTTAEYADFPRFTAFRSDLAKLGRQLLEVDGTKKIGQQLMKVADDVTDAYMTFAKANLHKVSTFSRKDGSGAAFKSREDAETAIARSGYKGQAIVLPVKRGENVIIMSPSMAQERGVWQGDDDKRITLSAEFGQELVEKIGRTRGKVSVPWQFERAAKRRAVLKRMGIETPAEFRSALREFISLQEAPKEADKIKQLERSMVGRKNDGLDFFPTPETTADEMIAAAGIEPGMSVLEPSAGWGHIADRIREHDVEPDVVEMSHDRRELLEAKGYSVVGRDFMDLSGAVGQPDAATLAEMKSIKKDIDDLTDKLDKQHFLATSRAQATTRNARSGQSAAMRDEKKRQLRGMIRKAYQAGQTVPAEIAEAVDADYNNQGNYEPIQKPEGKQYDRIIMNPPFSDRRDAQHVQHAYSLLKPNGRIVAIMGEGVFFGNDKKAQAFRDWLDSVDATVEKLPEGTFLDPSLPVNTGVNARMVVIDRKPSNIHFAAYDWDSILKKQRQVEGLQAAIKDPQTGKIYSGWTHQAAIEKAPKYGTPEYEKDSGVWGRLSEEWDRSTENVGFLDREGNFISREEANKNWGILTMEDKRDFLRKPRFSADFSTKGTAPGLLRGIANRARLADGWKVEVVASPAELPANVQAEMERQGISQVEGVKDGDSKTVFLVANGLSSMKRAKQVLAHETFHVGVIEPELRGYLKSLSAGKIAQFKRQNPAYAQADDLTIANEMLAQESETNLWLKRIIGKVNAWLKSIGIDLQIAKADVYSLIDGAMTRATERGESESVDFLADSSLLDNDKPVPDELSVNGWSALAKDFPYSLKTEPFASQGFSGLDVPSKLEMMDGVRTLALDPEIFNAIVRLIPVNVVNDFIARQGTPNRLLHDKPMLNDLLSVDSKGSIPIGVDVADSLVRVVASTTAKNSVNGSGRGNLKGLAALLAGKRDSIPGPFTGTVLRTEEGRIFLDFVGVTEKGVSTESASDFNQFSLDSAHNQTSEELFFDRLDKIAEKGINSKADVAVYLYAPLTDKTPASFPQFSVKGLGRELKTMIDDLKGSPYTKDVTPIELSGGFNDQGRGLRQSSARSDAKRQLFEAVSYGNTAVALGEKAHAVAAQISAGQLDKNAALADFARTVNSVALTTPDGMAILRDIRNHLKELGHDIPNSGKEAMAGLFKGIGAEWQGYSKPDVNFSAKSLPEKITIDGAERGSSLKNKRGSFGGASIKIAPHEGKSHLEIINGEAVLFAPSIFVGNSQLVQSQILPRAVQDFLSPLDEDVYIRVTDKKEDYDHLKNGTHRGSINRREGEDEYGISVAKAPEFPAKYAYLVKGEKIADGADGEPVLNTSTAKPIGQLLSFEKLRDNFYRQMSEKIDRLGMNREDVKALHLASYDKSETFNPQNPDIRFSVRSSINERMDDPKKVKYTVRDMNNVPSAVNAVRNNPKVQSVIGLLFPESGRKVSAWQRTVGTMFHLAESLERKGMPEFKRVFNKGQDFLTDISTFAIRAESLAPGIFPKMGSGAGLFKNLLTEDKKALSGPLIDGTLAGGGSPLKGRVWTNEELKTRYKLTPAQIALYREARAAADQSLDDVARSFIAKYAKQADIPFDRDLSVDDMAEDVTDRMQALIEDAEFGLENAVDEKMEKEQQAFIDLMKARVESIKELKDKTRSLKAHGYFPLSRFGEYQVTMRDEQGDVEYFGMYESRWAAARAAMMLRQDNPDMTVTQDVMSKEAFKLYGGLNLEAVELFADHLDATDNVPYQEYLKTAINNRSVLKRLIQRKGTAGFSEDAVRVLANFIVSNARHASTQYHLNDMRKLADAVPSHGQGDVKDQAVRLYEYLTKPTEEASRLRGYLFFHYLGGSLASGIVNMTQPAMMTAPYLSQKTSIANVTAKLTTAAARSFASPKTIGGELGAALTRAEEDGVTAPQEIHQLTAMASNRLFASNTYINAALKTWGSLFATAEVFNRKTTFIAAWEIAKENGEPNPYSEAKKAVYETQGIYNKGNRPNWGRGIIGAPLFTFKQFSVMYLEMFKRLPVKQRMLMLGVLVLAAGLEGLPFADDLEDLIDTLMQWGGYSWNTKAELRKKTTDLLGETGSDVALRGLSTLLPLDLHGRLGTGNLIPGTGILKQSQIDKTRDIQEFFGPAAGLLASLGDVLTLSATGMPGRAAIAGLPRAGQNIAQGTEMAKTGFGHDKQGRITTPVTMSEALIKLTGFNPQRVAKESEIKGQQMQDLNLLRVKKTAIVNQWANGIINKNQEEVNKAKEALKEWNKRNPDLVIIIDANTIRQKVRAGMSTGSQRFLKSVPRAQKRRIDDELD